MGQDPLADLRFPQTVEHVSACPICQSQTGDWIRTSDLIIIPCRRCGTFQVTGSAYAMLEGISERQIIALSGFSRDHLLNGTAAIINSDTVRNCSSWPMPTLRDRAMRMLRWAIEILEYKSLSSNSFDPDDDCLIGASYSYESGWSFRIASVLEELGYALSPDPLRVDGPMLARMLRNGWRITAKGFLAAEEEERTSQKSLTGFGAMWFAEEMTKHWNEAISPAISDAGYDPIRVDQVEHLGKIDDEIINQIRSSRFVVADFTGHRSGVYFEAGYALGLGIPVIWTCRKDDLDKLHFDIRQYNCIDWASDEDLRKRLAHRIENTVGIGPRRAT